MTSNPDDILGNLFNDFAEKETQDFYDQIENCDVLFLTGPVVRQSAYSSQTLNIDPSAHQLLKSMCERVGITNWKVFATYSTPDVEESDISTEEKNLLRDKLSKAITKANPKLIVPVSNLALVLTAKKSGIFGKRGKVFPFVGDEQIPVCPTYNIYEAVDEPSLRPLFHQDLDNAYHRYVKDQKTDWTEGYTLCDTEEKILSALSEISQADRLAFDLETTGLDFKLDKITTIAITINGREESFVFPMHHFESPLTDKEIGIVVSGLAEIMSNPSILKIAHHLQFDLKFLTTYGIKNFVNMGDTKIIHSLIDENKPHGLHDLLKEYFPDYLEQF